MKYCRNCGNEMEEGAIFCAECGCKANVETQREPKAEPSAAVEEPSVATTTHATPKNNTVILFTIISILAVVVVGVLILVFKFSEPIERPQNNKAGYHNKNNMTSDEENNEINFDIYTADDIISYVTLYSPQESAHLSPAYSTYYDNEFEFRIDYPAHFQRRETQGSVQRRIYATEDGSAVLKVNGGENLGGLTPRQLSNKLVSIYGGDVTYNPVNETWFAISTNGFDDYHYAFYRVDDGIIQGFEFHFYGSDNLDIYSKYIDHIYASFKKE